MRICPDGRVVVAKEQHLTATPQLSPHKRRKELNGFGDMLNSVRAVDEEVHDQKVGLLRVDPLHLAADVTASQRASLKELDVASLIADVLGHADHLLSIIANDPN